MRFIEPIAHAEDWMKRVALGLLPDGQAKAIACIRLYGTTDDSGDGRRILRDRTEETVAMLRGLAGDLDAPVAKQDFTGKQLREATDDECEIVGAAFVHTFRIMVV